MKTLLLILLSLLLFSVSCRTNAETHLVETTNNITEIKDEISLNPTPIPIQKDLNLKVGIVDVNEKQIICLRTSNSNLAEKMPVSIITSLYEKSQKVLSATVEKKLEKSCVSDDSDAGDSNQGETSYYSLVLTNKDVEKSEVGIGIGIIQPIKEIQIRNNLANIDLDSDGKLEFFRLCASNEGLHITIWTGKPLKGKRIWHYYYYLHYDTEADCKEADYEGTDD